MGQAKLRGSFEQRKAQAIERDERNKNSNPVYTPPLSRRKADALLEMEILLATMMPSVGIYPNDYYGKALKRRRY
jgi:hypothetical protein